MPLTDYMNKIICGDALESLRSLPDNLVHCVVTSPPYWRLRDYGVEGQLGLEPTMEEYIEKMLVIFREIKRVLRPEGTLWLNMGDKSIHSWCGQQGKNGQRCNRRIVPTPKGSKIPKGLKPKDIAGIPWRVAFALQDDGWYLRQDIIWHKPNPMPESIKDRPTRSHEYIFLFSKSRKYYYDYRAIMEPASLDTHARYARGRSDHHKWADGSPSNQSIAKSFEHMLPPGVNPKAALAVPPSGWNRGGGSHDPIEHSSGDKSARFIRSRQNPSFSATVVDIVAHRNKRSVWTISTRPYSKAHFATFPPDLIKPCILAGCPEGGIVLDPFGGSGTTAATAKALGRNYLIIELNPEYIPFIEDRLANPTKNLWRPVRIRKPKDNQGRLFKI
jgi:DNA modification methylase